MDVVWFLLSGSWAHPLPGSNFILINELAVNYGLNSFIELFSQNGFQEEDEELDQLYLGISILQPDVKHGRLKVIMAVDLTMIRTSRMNSSFFVLGNPDDLWITNRDEYYGSTLESSTDKRVFGRLADWLELKAKAIKMVILTCSKVAPITSVVGQNQIVPAAATTPSATSPVPEAGIKVRRGKTSVHPFLKNEKNLLNYLIKNQLDIVIMRGELANSKSCTLIDGLFPERLLEVGRLTPYLKINEESSGPTGRKSKSRCGSSLVRYQHLSFDSTNSSPGRSNSEYCPKVLKTLINEQQYDTKPSHTGIEGTCNFEDHSVYERFTGEQFVASVSQSDEILDEDLNNELAEMCGSMHDYRQDFASITNKALAFKAKRRKLWHVFDDETCPNDPFNTYKRQQKRNVVKAVMLIERYQSNKINVNDFTSNSDWIQYIFNPASKENSKYNCLYCSQYSNEFKIKKSQRSNLSAKEGVLHETVERNHREITNHAKLSTHRRVLQLYEEKAIDMQKSLMQGDIVRNEPLYFKITNNHMRLAFVIAKTKTSLNSYKEFAESRRKSGLEMGNGCKGKDVAKHMTQAISEMYLKETKEMILQANSAISLMMDGGDDGFGDHYATVLFQFLDKDKIVQVRFYRLIPLGVMSTGLAYFEAIEEALRNDGLKDHLKRYL